MANTWKYMLGGLLSGVGKGIVEAGAEKREKRLAELERQWRNEDNERDARLRDSLARDRAVFEKGLGEGEIEHWGQDASGEHVGFTAKGEPIRTGVKGKPPGSKSGSGSDDDDGGLSAEDKRLLDVLQERYTDIHPTTNEETVDHQAVYEALVKGGRQDLADIYGSGPGEPESEGTLPSWALEKAEAEASERAGWLSTDASDFPETDGDRREWINLRARELAAQGQGGEPVEEEEEPVDTPDPVEPEEPDAGKPEGAGTEANPYRPKTPAELDWVRRNAAPGAVVDVPGKGRMVWGGE